MICEQYDQLSLPEKFEMIGKIVHLVQNDSDVFNEVDWLVKKATLSGKLDNVKIMPEIKKP